MCRASGTVGRFEVELWEVFGIKTNVFTGDDWVAVLDGITLGKIKDIPKQATKAKMEELYEKAADAALYIVDKGAEEAMNKFNAKGTKQ